MSDASDKTEQEWVCIGLYRTVGGKLGVGFYPLDAEGQAILAEPLYFEIKNVRRWRAGVIYKVMATPDRKRANLNHENTAGVYADHAQIAAWQVTSRAEEAAWQAEKTFKEDSEIDRLAELLRPLRARYLRTNAIGKRAIEAIVLQSLRQPITKEERDDHHFW